MQPTSLEVHDLQALDDQFLPCVARTDIEYAADAGTTKRKELHGTTSVRALAGTWVNEPNDITLNAYKINFVPSQVGRDYCAFILLIEAALADDVTGAEFELHLHSNRVVKSSVSPCGQVQLNANQVEKSRLFQELLFNGLFGRLFTGSKSSGVRREFLIKDGKELLWSSSNMYLLLPVDPSAPKSHECVAIHWKGIDTCVSVIEFLRDRFSGDYTYCCRSSLTCSENAHETNRKGEAIIHMANKSVCVESLKSMVVLAIHTGRIYSVLDVVYGQHAESPFDDTKGKRLKFTSFADYYQKTYNICLQHRGQPLLLVKQSHHPYNHLLSNAKDEDDSISSKAKSNRAYVHIPPELLLDLSVSTGVLRSFYLLPSVMHRLTSMMLACQLREDIGFSPRNSHISSILILEAITTSRCYENFSLERLELLGDSVLKYAVSCHLFLRYPMKNEGQLSGHRSCAVRNLTLHKVGTNRSLQGYIRDSAFDPRRWVAPGQISLHQVPCTCGVNTSEVPLERAYTSEETSIVIGKTCDKGHRWMCSKTVADCVEALIGAYYVGGGLGASYSVMRWMGIDATFDPILIKEAKLNASVSRCHSRINEINALESKLDYTFMVKGLLWEAITHPSHQESGTGDCYQRLEFLGDAALDLLVTWHLFQSYTDIDPGELTDLRSASVSNENFAQATVRHNLQQYLRHTSTVLSEQIGEYVNCVSRFYCNKDPLSSFNVPKAPKVLGDVLESIAGAVLVDTDLNLEEVWAVFEPLLSPIVTPDKLELPPLRELLELCGQLGYPVNTKCTSKGEKVVAELSVQLEDDLLARKGYDGKRKAAKAQAALYLLKDLKEKGLLHAQSVFSKSSEVIRDNFLKKEKIVGNFLPLISSTNSSIEETCDEDDHIETVGNSELHESVVVSMKMEKGGPRSALFNLCTTLQWPFPKFESTEEKFRTPISLNGTVGFNKYTSRITLHIPNSTVINLEGEARADKKSSLDSAAVVMLRNLEKQGRCRIMESSA